MFFAQGYNIFTGYNNKPIPINAINWTPQKGKQEKAYKIIVNALVDSVFYGGGRASGKTEVGVHSTIARMVKYKGSFNGLYLRRTQVSLTEVIKRIKVALTKMNAKFKYNSMTKTFVLHGASLRIMRTDGDGMAELQGGEYNHIVIEEPQLIPKLNEIMDKCKALLRTTDKDCKPIIILLGNPLGPSTRYLRDEFVSKGEEIITNEDGKKQVFIKALIKDNPIMIEKNPLYIKTLENLPEMMSKAWLLGDFNVLSGTAFSISKEIDAVTINKRDIPYKTEMFCSMDWGFKAKSVIGFYIVINKEDSEQIYRFDELVFTQTGSSEVAKMLKEKIKIIEFNYDVKFSYLIADPSIYGHQDEQSVADFFKVYGLNPYKANNNRKLGLMMVDDFLRSKRLVVNEGCNEFWNTLPSLELAEDDYDISQNPKQDDHCYDEVRYAVMSRHITKEDINYVSRRGVINGYY